jgi:hypothetical protein
MVSDILSDGRINELDGLGGHISHLGGLIISLIVRVILTLLGTNMPIPAGIFMPVFLIGGILGRFIGIIMHLMLISVGKIDIPAYALVGACAFAAGVTHTISVAVIAVEMTGNIHMLLPCLIVSVLAAGITKSKGCSVYDQGMLNKGLESFQLLLMDSITANKAGDIMDSNSCSIPSLCSLSNLVSILQSTLNMQEEYPLINSISDQRIVGSVARTELYIYLEAKFAEFDQLTVLRHCLARDYKRHKVDLIRKATKVANIEKKRRYLGKFRTVVAGFLDKIDIFGDEDRPSAGAHTKLPSQEIDLVNSPTITPRNETDTVRNPLQTSESADTGSDDIESSSPKSREKEGGNSGKSSPRTRRDSVIDELGILTTALSSNAVALAKQAEALSLSAASVASTGVSEMARMAFESLDTDRDHGPVDTDILHSEAFSAAIDILNDASTRLQVNSHPFT